MTDQTPPNQSPLYMLSNKRFGGRTIINEQVISVLTTRTVIAPNNPNRLFLAVINEGINDVRISTDPTITSTSGWLLPASGGAIVFDWTEDGEGVGYPYYAIANVAAVNCRVREVIRE